MRTWCGLCSRELGLGERCPSCTITIGGEAHVLPREASRLEQTVLVATKLAAGERRPIDARHVRRAAHIVRRLAS